jgi:hypothetical protein
MLIVNKSTNVREFILLVSAMITARVEALSRSNFKSHAIQGDSLQLIITAKTNSKFPITLRIIRYYHD